MSSCRAILSWLYVAQQTEILMLYALRGNNAHRPTIDKEAGIPLSCWSFDVR